MVLPGTEQWENVVSTFEGGKLPNDTATKQFNESLPLLPEAKLKAELDARERLAASLHHQTLLEILNSNYSSCELFLLLSKSHLSTLSRNLQDFANA